MIDLKESLRIVGRISPEQVTQSPEVANSERPGTDVMITIFCDFRQFFAKKWRFSKKNPML
jgi:hypothetical protein